MKKPRDHRRVQRSAVFTSLLLFNFVLVVLQLWLFVSALEQIHDNGKAMIGWAALASLACLAVNLWMLIGVKRMERGD